MILVKIPNTEILLRQKEAWPPGPPFVEGPALNISLSLIDFICKEY